MTTVCTAETGSHRFCRHRWRLGEWTDTLNCHVLPLCSLYMRPDAEPRRSASAGSRSTFIPDLTEAARPLQEANNTQVDSNAQCASFWIFWSRNPFALATGSGAQWGPPENVWLEIHLLLHIRDLQRAQRGENRGDKVVECFC